MYPKKERIEALLKSAIEEMELLTQMSNGVKSADDFVTSMDGMILFRACGMSLQYITESFVKIRNLCGAAFFNAYSSIPWISVFGMRNFLSHEYGDVDAEGIVGTIKNDIPPLLTTTRAMLSDLQTEKLNQFFNCDTPQQKK